MFEWLKGDGAEVVGESLERRARDNGLGCAGPDAGGECILRGPLTVGDLRCGFSRGYPSPWFEHSHTTCQYLQGISIGAAVG